MAKLKDYEISFLVWKALDFPPYAELAEMLGKSPNTIKTISQRYNWYQKKLEIINQEYKPINQDNKPITISELIEKGLNLVNTGKIAIKDIADIKRLVEIQNLQDQKEDLGYLDNLASLTEILKSSGIDEVQDPDKEINLGGEL